MIYPIFTLINSIKKGNMLFLSIFSKKNIIFAFVFKSSSRRERKNLANGYLGDMEQKMELTAFVKWNLNQFSETFSLSQKSIDKLA